MLLINSIFSISVGSVTADIPFAHVAFDGLRQGESNDLLFYKIEPDALRMAILWTWQKYKRPLLVTENGLGDAMHLGKHDEMRAAYHSAYLRTLVKTVKDFSVDIIGYCAWSLIDSFEWSAGYKRPFGLVHVDYEHGTLDRSLKDSSSFWIEMAETGVVPLAREPTSSTPSSNSPAAAIWTLALSVFLTLFRH
ncbi:beta-glucosidase 1A-like [Thrips palmi]|uniref:beta-glucosidase n=1 Tax=Thrips palmi TaxID=161013 RepID=A0A6P8YUD4_THRPL|nr:beta-glucosidase 1A-like [Thrips palmi]